MRKMTSRLDLFVILSCVGFICSADERPRKYNHGVKLPTTRPLNIAHRGSSGTHPEHTAAAYEQAIRDGADVIECDVYVTRDRELVCLHDVYLGTSTDVDDRAQFATRRRSLTIPGIGEKNDYFAFDFTLAELKTLRVKQSKDFRDPKYNGMYQISTLAEYIAVARSADRPVGIYPEIKKPAFVNAQPFMNETRVEDLVLATLTRHGYTEPDDPCFVQSFDVQSLLYVRNKTRLPLVVLIDADNQYLGPHLNDSRVGADWTSDVFYGIGAWKPLVARFWNSENGYKNWIWETTGLAEEVHRAGLKLHLYTFRNEDRFLPWDFAQDPAREYEFFMDLGVDGYFTDFPATFDRVLSQTYGTVTPDVECPNGGAAQWMTTSAVVTSTLAAALTAIVI